MWWRDQAVKVPGGAITKREQLGWLSNAEQVWVKSWKATANENSTATKTVTTNTNENSKKHENAADQKLHFFKGYITTSALHAIVLNRDLAQSVSTQNVSKGWLSATITLDLVGVLMVEHICIQEHF